MNIDAQTDEVLEVNSDLPWDDGDLVLEVVPADDDLDLEVAPCAG